MLQSYYYKHVTFMCGCVYYETTARIGKVFDKDVTSIHTIVFFTA